MQNPLFSQNFNRYSYGLNNPLKYTDPTGEKYEWCPFRGTYVDSSSGETASYEEVYYAMFKAGHFRGPNSLYGENSPWNRNLWYPAVVGSNNVGGGTGVNSGPGTRGGIAMANGVMTIGGQWVTYLRTFFYSTDGGNTWKHNGGDSWVQWVQTGLDAVGLIPFWGEIADGLNALIYLGRGDRLNAGLSAGAMIPFVGWAATSGKFANKARKGYSVYRGFDAAGNTKYVGMTGRNPAVRFSEHAASGTSKAGLQYRVVDGATDLTRAQARGMEQTLINQHGLNNLFNMRNSIAPKFWWQYGIKL